MSISIIYTCPNCRQGLTETGQAYHCNNCSKDYPIDSDVPIFGDVETYYGEVNRSQMAALSNDAHKLGYVEAIKRYVKNPFVVTYILDESRALWTDLLPLDSETDVLDVGCGWGTNAIPMARKARLVAAVDATLERVAFVNLRAHQSGLTNVRPALASATALPYPAESFDVVAFNGVLEWLGAIDQKSPPIEIQKQALREAHRVLRPGGLVYIGIENRFSLRYFMGAPDDHSFIRFTTLMPRWLAQVYFKMRSGQNYFMHTHSLNKYQLLMQQTGFDCDREILPWPDYRNPKRFVPLGKKEILELLSEELGKISRLSRRGIYLSILRLLTTIVGSGFFCHSFSFIYKKAREEVDQLRSVKSM